MRTRSVGIASLAFVAVMYCLVGPGTRQRRRRPERRRTLAARPRRRNSTLEAALHGQRKVSPAELFSRARAVVGVAEPIDAAASEAIAAAWTRRREKLPPLTTTGARLTYVRIFKCANDAFHAHVLAWARGAGAGAGRATTRFAFSREPVDRFVAAYAEVEMRLSERCALDAGALDLLGAFYASAAPGRVRAFIADFLLTDRLGRYRTFWSDGDDRGTRLLEEAVFEHVWPQASFVAPLALDFVGRLETFDADLARLGARAGTTLAWDPTLGVHGDRPNEKRAAAAAKVAARAAIATDPGVVGALCYLYFGDFAKFGYDLPARCRALPVTTLG